MYGTQGLKQPRLLLDSSPRFLPRFFGHKYKQNIFSTRGRRLSNRFE